jgi:hypothetical protein
MEDRASSQSATPLALRARTSLARREPDATAAPPVLVTAAPMVLDIPTIQAMATVAPNTTFRRLLFMWFRVFVFETKANGRVERVNIKLPLPIPLVGAFLSRRMSSRQAMKALAAAEQSPDGFSVIERYMDSNMGFEFIRVEERNPTTGRYELVVVGFD